MVVPGGGGGVGGGGKQSELSSGHPHAVHAPTDGCSLAFTLCWGGNFPFRYSRQ